VTNALLERDGRQQAHALRVGRRRFAYRPPCEVAEASLADAVPDLRSGDLLSAPGRFYLAGDASLLHRTQRVALVGSRDASEAGMRRARTLGAHLAKAGVVVVSGLARGIDAAAHAGAIAAAGRTIAVIATPLTRVYPPEHAKLQAAIYRKHLLVSQFRPGHRTSPSDFIRRNRAIALLSHASVVVEAGDRSGSLSEAAEALRLGRPVFLMRSAIDRPELAWPAKLLAAGAIPLEDVGQILELLHP
jgi:DNA processing protein